MCLAALLRLSQGLELVRKVHLSGHRASGEESEVSGAGLWLQDEDRMGTQRGAFPPQAAVLTIFAPASKTHTGKAASWTASEGQCVSLCRTLY